jgi:malate synthase
VISAPGNLPDGVSNVKTAKPNTKECLLNREAVEFLRDLHERFESRRQELLLERDGRQRQFDLGYLPDFLPGTDPLQRRQWTITPLPSDFAHRQVTLSGPPDREALSRGLDSGANVLIADFDDQLSPTWANCLEGHACLREVSDGLGNPAVVFVRPRNWSLEEKHFLVRETPISASLFDFGLSIFHGSCARFSLPKLETHQEGHLWGDIFRFTEERLAIPHGTIRVILSIETISAAFEMEELLYELRDYAVALECSPTNYLSSFARTFRAHSESLLPQRNDITMNQPFLHALQELLVHTCHKHGIHAISSWLPQLRARGGACLNMRHEVARGFDGISVADANLVPVARAAFEQAAKDAPSMEPLERDCYITSGALISRVHGKITMVALKENVELALEHLEAWLSGGSLQRPSRMGSMATVELCRAQLWQWIRHSARLTCGRRVTRYLIECFVRDLLVTIERRIGEVEFAASKFRLAADLLLSSCTDGFGSPLVFRAYDRLG